MTYYRGGQHPGLPFDPVYIEKRNLVRDRPRLGRVDLGGLNDFSGDLVDFLIREIQDNAERNNLRTFAFNFWGDQGFENDQFVELLRLFAAYVEVILSTQRNVNPIAVIEGEVGPFVKAATAKLSETFEGLREYIPHEVEREIYDNLNEWNGIARSIRNFTRQDLGSSGYQRGGGGYQRSDSRPGGFNRQGGTNQAGYRGGDQRQRDAGDLRPTWERDRPAQGGGPAPQRPGFNRLGVQNGENALDPRNYRRPEQEQEQRPTSRYDALRREINPEVEAPPRSPGAQAVHDANVRAPQVTATKASAERPCDVVPIPGENRYLRPAYQMDQTPAYGPTNQPEVFDRTKNILFYVVEDGKPTSEVIQSKQGIVEGGRKVDYLEHEMDEQLRKMYRVNAGVFMKEQVVPTVGALRRLVPNQKGNIAVLVDDTKRLELDRAGAPRQLTDIIQAASLGRAIFLARMEMDRMGLEDGSEFLEYQVEQVDDALVFRSALSLVLALGNCKSFGEFHALLMNQHANQEAMTDDLFELISKRMTDVFNRFLAKQMFMDINVDDFMQDWPEFPAYCKDKFGDGVHAKVEASAGEIITRAVSILHGESLTKYLHGMTDDDRARLPEPAVFCDRYSVTQLPWTMFEMESHWRLEGLVTDANAKKLHEALFSVIARTGTNGIHTHVLLTKDDREIFAYKSPLLDGDYTVTTEPPGYVKDLSKRFAL